MIDDEGTPLLVDISLCLSGDASFPWLREKNTIVMTMGYIDVVDMIVEDVSRNFAANPLSVNLIQDMEPVPTLILRALVVTERPELDLDIWNSAIDAFRQKRSKAQSTSVNQH